MNKTQIFIAQNYSANEELNEHDTRWKRNLPPPLIPIDEKVVHEENFRKIQKNGKLMQRCDSSLEDL